MVDQKVVFEATEYTTLEVPILLTTVICHSSEIDLENFKYKNMEIGFAKFLVAFWALNI